MKIPSPQELGLPPKYRAWRPGQQDAIRVIEKATTPTVALMLPPGAGKSGIYMAWAVWKKKRVAILTSNKLLQDQLASDFASLGVVDLRGQSNYTCEITMGTVADAPCHGGMPCDLKTNGGCTFFADLRRAKTEQLVSMNYAFFLHHKEALGTFDAIIMDEAHQAFEWLSKHVSVTLSRKDVDKYFHRHPILDWKTWANYQKTVFEGRLKELKRGERTKEVYEEVRILRRFFLQVSTLAYADPKTLVFEKRPTGWKWECVWPGAYRHLLMGTSRKYIMTSGTMTPRTMGMLGFTKADYTWASYPSTFPVERRPIHILPAPRLNASTGPGELVTWRTLIDQYMDTRTNRRGVIHAGSYSRCEYLLANSRHTSRFVTHENSKGIPAAISAFLASKDGILVSPSVTEGVNFPYEACEFQIIAKLPFGDPRNPVLAERTRQDPEYPWYTAALVIVQAAMRGMRAADDFCEVAIADGSWQHWFYHRAKYHFPSYFLDAITVLNVVPPSFNLSRKPNRTKIKKNIEKKVDVKVVLEGESVLQPSQFVVK